MLLTLEPSCRQLGRGFRDSPRLAPTVIFSDGRQSGGQALGHIGTGVFLSQARNLYQCDCLRVIKFVRRRKIRVHAAKGEVGGALLLCNRGPLGTLRGR